MMCFDDDLLPYVLDYFSSGAAREDREAIMEQEQSDVMDIGGLEIYCDRMFERGEYPQGGQVDALWVQNLILVKIALQLAKLNEGADTLSHWTQLVSHRLDEMGGRQ